MADSLDTARLASIEETVDSMNSTLGLLLRAVQGEIHAGNVGLVRRVSAIEELMVSEKRESDQALNALKVKIAGYGFLGSGAGGALLAAILKTA